jgi:hypothetical protein
MSKHRPARKKNIVLILLAVVLTGVWLPKIIRVPFSSAASPHKVYVAFGLHVNLYHSFRGDTDDENGFGQDIRVIRHTLHELDRLNQSGIPVSAVWDFDNLFSLQEILPAHAPDIIEGVHRRIRETGDEAILMSYNNGLTSAMNHEEFMAAVGRAVTNAKGSGIRDLFGAVAPIVRPQEMMTTPGHFKRYQEMGIDYVSLYYSATPFDAFRLFSRQLTVTEAHNPIVYRNPASGEQIGIIPTYHAGDLVEHVSLRNWVQELRDLQCSGRIDRDVLVFINFDADAEFWSGAALPWYLRWLPNTGGIGQLVESVAGLDYVRFSNLTDYLAVHPPQGTVYFGQDTADGSFNGYNSWAEKAYASDYWTRIERNRRACRMARRAFALSSSGGLPGPARDLLGEAFEIRLRALSTTNFGLATPFLARQREAAMASLLARLDDCSTRIEKRIADCARGLAANTVAPGLPLPGAMLADTFLHLNDDVFDLDGGDRQLELTLPEASPQDSRYVIADTSGRIVPASMTVRQLRPDGSPASITLRVDKRHDMPDGVYFLYRLSADNHLRTRPPATIHADRRVLRNESLAVHFDGNGRVTAVTANGMDRLDAGSLMPYIVYHGERITPERLSLAVNAAGADGSASVRLHGPWPGPAGKTRAPGWVDVRLRLSAGVPYLFIDGTIRYPDTLRSQVLQAEKPMLARKIDSGWEEVAPLELRFSPRASVDHPFIIHKRNYLGETAAYAVDYFRHAPENRNVAGINNHITPAYAAVTTARSGLAVAMNPGVTANFAYCPFKMSYQADTGDLAIRANPFGTYHGSQVLPPTRGNRQGYEAVLLSAPQLHSAGPTYNGYQERFDLMLAFFEDDVIPADVQADLVAFARRPMTVGTMNAPTLDSSPINPLPPAGFMALNHRDGVLLQWEGGDAAGIQYRIRCRRLADGDERVFTSPGHSLFLDASALDLFHGEYTATLEAERAHGAISRASTPIRIRYGKPVPHGLDIPLDFKAKVLWANLQVWFQRNLL